jgi:hypothetical protein
MPYFKIVLLSSVFHVKFLESGSVPLILKWCYSFQCYSCICETEKDNTSQRPSYNYQFKLNWHDQIFCIMKCSLQFRLWLHTRKWPRICLWLIPEHLNTIYLSAWILLKLGVVIYNCDTIFILKSNFWLYWEDFSFPLCCWRSSEKTVIPSQVRSFFILI